MLEGGGIRNATMPLSPLLTLIAPASAALFFEGWGFYLGDPHAHTGASRDGGSSDLGIYEGDFGSVAGLARAARDKGLDWMAITDHVNGQYATPNNDFLRVLQRVLDAHDPEGGFVTLVGAELWYSFKDRGLGHKNLYLFASNEELQGFTLADAQYDGGAQIVSDCQQIWDWVAELDAQWGPALLLAHHPAFGSNIGTDWDCQAGAESWSPAVEVYSRHGNSMGTEVWDPLWELADPQRTVEEALDPDGRDLRLGFLAGTDAHDSDPGAACSLDRRLTHHPYGGGLTIVMLPESETFDRPAIHEAITQRRSYATSGPLVPVVVAYRSAGDELGGMGEILSAPPGQDLHAELRLPAVMDPFVIAVQLRTRGQRWIADRLEAGRYRAVIPAQEAPRFLYPVVVLEGDAFYRRACDDGGQDSQEHIWLSPTWFDGALRDLDGDGSSAAQGDCDDEDPAVHPAAEELCDSDADEDCDGLVDDLDPDCRQDAATDSVADSAAAPATDSALESALPEQDDSAPGPQDESQDPQGCAGCSDAASGSVLWLALLALALRGLRSRTSGRYPPPRS